MKEQGPSVRTLCSSKIPTPSPGGNSATRRRSGKSALLSQTDPVNFFLARPPPSQYDLWLSSEKNETHHWSGCLGRQDLTGGVVGCSWTPGPSQISHRWCRTIVRDTRASGSRFLLPEKKYLWAEEKKIIKYIYEEQRNRMWQFSHFIHASLGDAVSERVNVSRINLVAL